MYDLALIGGMCYINHALRMTNVYIKDGRIASIDDAVLPALKASILYISLR